MRRSCAWSSRRRRSTSCGWPTGTPGSSSPATVITAALAWAISGDPVRALAVVVVATPCPLILRRPDGALRVRPLARRSLRRDRQGRRSDRDTRPSAHRPCSTRPARSARSGHPERREMSSLIEIHRPAELLALAASADRMSAHVLGEALVRAATDAGLTLSTPSHVREDPGQGIQGVIDGRAVAVGSRALVRSAGIPEDEIAVRRRVARPRLRRGARPRRHRRPRRWRDRNDRRAPTRRQPDGRATTRRRHPPCRDGVGDRRSVAERIGRELGVDRSRRRDAVNPLRRALPSPSQVAEISVIACGELR